MDLDRDNVDAKTPVAQTPVTRESASPPGDGASIRTGSSPVAVEVKKRAMDHDSLVTVRLSEPPSLHINTAIPPNPLPSRKTVYGIDYTPNDAMAESLKEEENSDADKDPETPVTKTGLNLQEELGQLDSDFQEDEEGAETVEGRSSLDSDKVDWEGLQKTEDMESKDQESDNVGVVFHVFGAELISFFL